MVVVSSIVLQYAARGAEQAARADSKVRESVQKTAKHARHSIPDIEKWLKKERVALVAIGGALAAALGAVVAGSPLLHSNMSILQSDFSLLADEIGQHLQPVFDVLDKALQGAAEAFAKLPGPVKVAISFVILLAGVLGTLLIAIGTLAGPLLAGAVLVGGWIASLAAWGNMLGIILADIPAMVAGIGVLVGTFAVWVLHITGVLDWLAKLGQWLGSLLPQFLKDAITSFLAFFSLIGAAVVGFVQGGFGGASDAVVAMFNQWMGSLSRLGGDLLDVLAATGKAIADFAVNAYHWGIDMMANLARGIADGAVGVWNAAKDALAGIAKHLSFDLSVNDAMAARWGGDLGAHFGRGLAQSMDSLTGQTAKFMPTLAATMTAAPQQAPIQAQGGSTTVLSLTFERGSITNQGTGTAQIDEDRVVDKIVRRVSDRFSGRSTR